MAAIHFNVEIDKAIQVLVRPQIDKALTLADSVALDSIRSVPAFEENCEDLIEKSLSNWVQHEPVTIAYAAGVLKTLKLTDSLANRKSWSHLRRGIGQVTDWKGLNQKAAEGICELLRSASVDEVERLAIRTVVGIRNLKPSASNDTKPTEEWEKHSKDSIAVILETLVELKQTHTIQKHFRVPGNADAYVETLHKIGRDRPKEEILSFFISESTPEKISKTIADLCNTGNFVETHSHMIENLAIIGRRDWKELTQAFDNRLNPQVVTLNSGQALGLIESLLYLSFIQKDKHAVNSLRSSVNHGRIANYLQRALTEKHPQLQIAAIFSIMFENPTGQNANNVGESSSGYSYYNQIRISPTGHSAVIEGLASLVLKYNLVEWTVDQLGNSNLTAIIQAIVQELLVKSKSSNLISSEFFISRLKLFEAHLSRDDIESITGNLAVNQDLCAYMRSISFDISFQKIYYFLSKEAYSSQNAEMNEFLSDNLKSIQKSDWKQQLSGSLGLLDTSLNLLHSKIPIQLGFNFSDAVLEILKDLRKKQVYPEYHSNSWKDFANLMDHSNRETFFRNIVSDFLTIPSRSVSIPIKLLSDDFINSKAISERSDEFFRTVAKEIVSRSTSDSSEIECLLAILEGSSSAKDNIKKETKRALASQIQELLSKPSERSNAVVEALKSLASKIGDS